MKRLYFMGICGTAMGNAALMARQLGYEVCGSDSAVYPPMSELLAHSGIKVFEGYDPERLERLVPDCVVVGNVVSRGHPEVEWLLRTRKFPYTSLPALLHDLFLRERQSIVISGTHGKTTTTCLTAFLFKAQGRDPGYLIGGVPRDLPTGAHSGAMGAPFVIEGDEYDSAFFDKRSKFIHYAPDILVMNNLEFDHADIFRDLEDVKRTFRHLLRLVPDNGFVLVNGEDPNIAELLPISWTRVLRVGTGPDNDLRITDFHESREGIRFVLNWQGQLWTEVRMCLGGAYNARNAAMAALAVGLALNPEDPTQISLAALGDFQGVKRRQEMLHEKDDLVVIEDFGHHPTAIRYTLDSLRLRYPDYTITACFEPRSNTARTRIFQREFTEALREADAVFIAPVNRMTSLSCEQRLDTIRMARDLSEAGLKAHASESSIQLLDAVVEACKEAKGCRQLFCFFSNGSFDGIMRAFLERVCLIPSFKRNV